MRNPTATHQSNDDSPLSVLCAGIADGTSQGENFVMGKTFGCDARNEMYDTGANVGQLLAAVLDVIPDLERLVSKSGPGPDRRLWKLENAIKAVKPDYIIRSTEPTW